MHQTGLVSGLKYHWTQGNAPPIIEIQRSLTSSFIKKTLGATPTCWGSKADVYSFFASDFQL